MRGLTVSDGWCQKNVKTQFNAGGKPSTWFQPGDFLSRASTEPVTQRKKDKNEKEKKMKKIKKQKKEGIKV